jgi:hypothetical protein
MKALTISLNKDEDEISKQEKKDCRDETGANGFCQLYNLNGADGFEFNKIYFEISHYVHLGAFKDIMQALFASDVEGSVYKSRIMSVAKLKKLDELVVLMPQKEDIIENPSTRLKSYSYDFLVNLR